MYLECTNKTYSPSDVAKVAVQDNTDFSISGTSKRITFADGANEYLDVGFDSIDLTDYEELCFYVYTTPFFYDGNILQIVVGGQTYNFSHLDKHRQFHLIKIDASVLSGPISSIRVKSLVSDMILFFDFPLVRKAGLDTIDKDLMLALSNHFTLDYDVTTTLASAVSAGAKSISLASRAYIKDYALLKITNGATEELVTLESSRNGNIKGSLSNAFPAGSTVEVQVPIEYGHENDNENDPYCGIVVVGKATTRSPEMVKMNSGAAKKKLYLGELALMIYIEASSEEKLLFMTRQFDRYYGAEFQFILDGERVDAYAEDSAYIGKELGGMARMSYTYNIQPQPVTEKIGVPITDLTLTVESKKDFA